MATSLRRYTLSALAATALLTTGIYAGETDEASKTDSAQASTPETPQPHAAQSQQISATQSQDKTQVPESETLQADSEHDDVPHEETRTAPRVKHTQDGYVKSISKNVLITVLATAVAIECCYGHEAAITLVQEFFAARGIILSEITLSQVYTYVQGLVESQSSTVETAAQAAHVAPIASWCEAALNKTTSTFGPSSVFAYACDTLRTTLSTHCGNLTNADLTEIVPQACKEIFNQCTELPSFAYLQG